MYEHEKHPFDQWIEDYCGEDDPVRLRNGFGTLTNDFLYPSGAIIHNPLQRKDSCICHRPPKDDAERLRLQHKYHSLKLQREIKAFDDAKAQALADSSACYRTGEVKAKLKALKHAVTLRRKKLDEIQQEQEELNKGNVSESVSRSMIAQREAAEFAYRSEISQIEI